MPFLSFLSRSEAHTAACSPWKQKIEVATLLWWKNDTTRLTLPGRCAAPAHFKPFCMAKFIVCPKHLMCGYRFVSTAAMDMLLVLSVTSAGCCHIYSIPCKHASNLCQDLLLCVHCSKYVSEEHNFSFASDRSLLCKLQLYMTFDCMICSDSNSVCMQ